MEGKQALMRILRCPFLDGGRENLRLEERKGYATRQPKHTQFEMKMGFAKLTAPVGKFLKQTSRNLRNL